MKRLRVLLVDDAPEFLRSARTLLSRDGRTHIVGCARNGSEAVEMATELKPDLVLMDLAMPVMNGLTAAGLIKKTHPHIRVVLTSLLDEPEYRLSAMVVGADEFVDKQSLADAVTAILDRAEG